MMIAAYEYWHAEYEASTEGLDHAGFRWNVDPFEPHTIRATYKRATWPVTGRTSYVVVAWVEGKAHDSKFTSNIEAWAGGRQTLDSVYDWPEAFKAVLRDGKPYWFDADPVVVARPSEARRG